MVQIEETSEDAFTSNDENQYGYYIWVPKRCSGLVIQKDANYKVDDVLNPEETRYYKEILSDEETG